MPGSIRSRSIRFGSKLFAAKCVEYADLVVNQTNYSVIYMGKTVEMPPKELELLYYLAASPNQVFTREQLLASGQEASDSVQSSLLPQVRILRH